MGVIDEIKQKTDIVEVISQYTTLTKSGRTFRALCPFHSEKNPSFFVYPEQQSWHCFGACNTGGDVFSFIMKKQDIDFGQALRLLAERAGVTIPSRSGKDTKKDAKERLYQINEAATQYFNNLLINSAAGEKARKYASSRGISLKTITDFQLGFSLDSWEALKQYLMERGYTENELLEAGLIVTSNEGKTYDRFRHRLMFPIKDARDQSIGFGARALDDSLPKYLNSPQTSLFDKSGSLYGINLAVVSIRQQDIAVVVEGYMDVITAHQNGFNNVVASMGTAITDRQITILKKLSRNIGLALDADAAGEEAMLRCVEYENSLGAEVKVIVLPGGKDPDDVIREDIKMWQRLMADALPVVDYTFNMVSSKSDLATARGKSSVVDELLPIIAKIKDNTRRDHYLENLAKLVGTNYRNVEATLRAYIERQKLQKPKQEATSYASRPLLSSPLEEYCLTLLLQHPEFKNSDKNLLPEYFENSENREIFVTWRQTDDLQSLRARLEPAIWEHLDTLVNKNMSTNQIDQKYINCVLRLHEKFLRSLETKRGASLALEAESGGTAAELAKLKEQGITTSVKLGEIFAQKAGRGREQRR